MQLENAGIELAADGSIKKTSHEQITSSRVNVGVYEIYGTKGLAQNRIKSMRIRSNERNTSAFNTDTSVLTISVLDENGAAMDLDEYDHLMLRLQVEPAQFEQSIEQLTLEPAEQ
jgi:hypothetical protein